MILSRRKKVVKLNKYLMQFPSPSHPINPTLSLAERKKSTQPEQFAFFVTYAQFISRYYYCRLRLINPTMTTTTTVVDASFGTLSLTTIHTNYILILIIILLLLPRTNLSSSYLSFLCHPPP